MKDLSRSVTAGIITLLFGLASLLGWMAWQSMQRPTSLPIVFHASPNSTSQSSSEKQKEIVVHVVGAVKKPGVYRLNEASRGEDAVKAAGGATQDADINAINLAALLQDGMRIEIPLRGTTPAPLSPSPTKTQKPTTHASANGKASPTRPININTASQAELETLLGVGAKTAQTILQFRKANGGFRKPEDLMSVKGLGPKKYARLKASIRTQ